MFLKLKNNSYYPCIKLFIDMLHAFLKSHTVRKACIEQISRSTCNAECSAECSAEMQLVCMYVTEIVHK